MQDSPITIGNMHGHFIYLIFVFLLKIDIISVCYSRVKLLVNGSMKDRPRDY